MSEKWQRVASIREISEFVRDGTHASFQRVSHGKPLLSAKNITEGGDVVWDSSDSLVSEADYRAISRSFRVIRGDVLLTIVGSIGRVALVRNHDAVVFQRSVAVIRPRGDLIDRDFLVHTLRTRSVQSDLLRRANATAQAGVYLGELERVLIPVPPLTEQRRIAEILDTADEAIRSTERLIAKLEQVKQGLLHDLLTRGIDESGYIRDQHCNPHEFVATELGLLPRSWRVMWLREVASYQNGGAFPSSEYANEGIPLVRPGNLGRGERVSWDASHTTFLPPRWGKVVPELLVGPGEVLMNLTAQSLEEGFLGRACITSGGTSCLLNQRIARFRPYSIQPDFLLWFFRGPVFRRQIARSSTGTKVQHLYNSDIDSVRVPVPQKTAESRRISDILWSISSTIDAETDHLIRSRLLKRGLMEDLLTGRVRVGAAG